MTSIPRPLRAIALATTFLMTGGILLPGSANAVNVNSAPIVFPNGVNDPNIGVGAGVGFSHRYDNVVTVGGVSVDAIVSVVSVTGIDSDDNHANGANNLLDELDENGSDGDAIKLNLDVFGLDSQSGDTNFQGEAVIRVAFVQDNTSTAATLQNVVVNVKDIDSNQFVEFPGITSYLLSNPTDLNVATNTTHPNLVPAGSTRFFEPLGNSSQSTDEQHWAQISFSQLTSVDIKLGARESGSAFFGLDFSAANFTSTTTNTVYTVGYNNNGSNDPTPPSITGSGAVTVAPAPSRPGFTFAGWNTELNGSGVGVQAGASLTPSANVTLFAQWTAIAATTTVAPATPVAPAATVAPSGTPTQRAEVTSQDSLPATGTNGSPLLLAMMGMTLVGFGWASHVSRRASR
jgi:uncharacterized repeat protein (TIGR02543 family)